MVILIITSMCNIFAVKADSQLQTWNLLHWFEKFVLSNTTRGLSQEWHPRHIA
jgi:hypothetical protein